MSKIQCRTRRTLMTKEEERKKQEERSYHAKKRGEINKVKIQIKREECKQKGGNLKVEIIPDVCVDAENVNSNTQVAAAALSYFFNSSLQCLSL